MENNNANLVIEELSRQVAELSKEKAMFYAIAVQKEREIKGLKEELNKLHKENQELDKQIEEKDAVIIDQTPAYRGDYVELIDAVSTIGFPAAVAAFFVWWTTLQLSKRIDMLCDQINENTKAVITLATVFAKDKSIDLNEVNKFLGGNE